jgi:hypothetical protein
LHGGEADEFYDEEGAYGEDNSAGLAEYVVKNLRHGLESRRGEERRDVVSHDEA